MLRSTCASLPLSSRQRSLRVNKTLVSHFSSHPVDKRSGAKITLDEKQFSRFFSDNGGSIIFNMIVEVLVEYARFFVLIGIMRFLFKNINFSRSYFSSTKN